MNDEEIKQKSDEIIEIIEKDLIAHVKNLLTSSFPKNTEITNRTAEVILSKIGKKMLLKVLSA